VQGLGAANRLAGSALHRDDALRRGAERNKALGIWGAVGGSGPRSACSWAASCTKYLGWEWIFFVNVPVGAAVLALTVALVAESRVETTRRRYDIAER
jgi:hypothetical protein